MPTPISSPSTPLRRRAQAKKHASIASPTSDSTPLRPTNRTNQMINDDAAERAARRKSAHFADIGLGHAGKENPGGMGSPADVPQRKGSALAVQQVAARRAKRLSTVGPTTPPVSMEVMNTNFEEWMKLATDNKITATNTWNFALIDYFHDLTLLRNGPDDQSINFQKASCTLDGCVKIWTSRVDSVATETGKLLSGLAGGGGGGDDGDDVDGEDDESGEPKAARKSHRSEATLAKSFTTLQVKKFDLEFTVDPLFKKTSADFDEGGAMGLLMNHLGIDGTGRVVFDAGDAVIEEEYEEEEEPDDELVDISRLRELIPTEEETAPLAISETLATFHFSTDADDMPDLAAITGLSSLADEPERPVHDAPVGEAVDFFGDDDYDMGGPSGYAGDDMSMADDGEFAQDVFGTGAPTAQHGDSQGPFDPRRGADLVMSFIGTEDGDNMFDYFDSGFGKAWAGAEHWKLRKVSRKDTVIAGTREKKEKKAPFTIDFMNPEAAQSSKTLFAPGTKATNQLPSSSRSRGKKSAAAARREEWLLPDDMHFSSQQLLRLFLKPKFALRMRRGGGRVVENANGEIDENFWAQAAADRAEGSDAMDMDSGALPFESQFFHDDGDGDDDGFVDDAFVDDALAPLPDGDVDDLWQSTQGEELRRPRPENVRYAKKAKRVDVKRLKDDIWDDLRGLVDDSVSDPESQAPQTPAEPADPSAPLEPVKTFDHVIQSLRSNYPREKMSEISTSFCFICLLHLANEEGLRIETARSDGLEGMDVGMKGYADLDEEDEERGFLPSKRMDEGDRIDRIVGELQALKVYKDPNAGRAA